MSDPTLFYTGMFCFGLTLLGLGLTVYEFKKFSEKKTRPGNTPHAVQGDAVTSRRGQTRVPFPTR
jgi:hypothetical protein